MKIIISTIGKFQLFKLAQQLVKRGFLARLINSYPKFETTRYGIPRKLARSIVIKEILQRGWTRFPKFLKNAYNPTYVIHEIFDVLAYYFLIQGDILTGTSSTLLHTLRRAKRMGMLTIVERASAHIAYQDRILREEYERQGITPPPIQLPYKKIIEKELQEYEEADYISVPSFFAVRTFLEYGISEKKIIHVPYGVDIEEFRKIPKTDNIFRVIFAGGMSFQKGVHYLLQAFHELHLPKAELLLVGSMHDEMRPFFKKYEGSFRFIGYVPQRELYRHYSASSVFAMMSIQDGFGLVQAQAMACGLPVIATTNTGGEDLIREGKDGFIIPIRDVDAIKKKIIYLYEHPEICAQMGRSAMEHISEGFTWDDYGDKMIQAYENILARRN
ncbi:glycosyltransferase family 4 protein [Candidatus Wolfebacteria bacterium]|nr:glycosyltransferase family 4 protein [Candidatus Wolfebacteria bacterium]